MSLGERTLPPEDFIWGKNDVTKEQASVAIWLIHAALRPRIAEAERG